MAANPTRGEGFKAAAEVALAALEALMRVQQEFEDWHPVYDLDIQSMADQIRGANHG